MTKRNPETVAAYRARKAEIERRRRADPIIGERIKEQRRAAYANGGRERQRAYYARLRKERFFHWRARLWSSRWQVNVTEAELIGLWDAQDGKCALSGAALGPDAHLDHVEHVSAAGSHTIENLRWLDPWVNVARQNLTDAEFIERCRQISKVNR